MLISPALLTRNFFALFATTFFFYFGHDLLLPLFPLYLKQLGIAGPLIGTIVASYMVASVFTRPWVGRLCDIYPIKKVLLVTLGLFTALFLLYPIVTDPFALTILRFIHGASYGAVYTAASTYLIHIIPAQNKAEGIGHFSNAIKLASAMGPALGLWMFAFLPLNIAFMLALLVSAVGLLLSLNLKTVSVEPNPVKSTGKARLIHTKALTPGLIMLTNSLVYGALMPFVSFVATEKHIEGIGLFYTVYAVSLMASRGLCGKWADQMGRHTILIPGLLMVVLTLCLFYWAPDKPWFLLTTALYGLGAGTVQPILMAYATDETTPQTRGSAMATFTMCNDMGLAAGSFIMGSLGSQIGYTPILLILAGITSIGLLSYLFFRYHRQTRRQQVLINE